MGGELTTATAVLEAIPAHLDAYGWCQGADHNGEGRVSLGGDQRSDQSRAGALRGISAYPGDCRRIGGQVERPERPHGAIRRACGPDVIHPAAYLQTFLDETVKQ